MTTPSIDVEVIIDPAFHASASPDRLADAVLLAAQSRGFSHGQIAIRVTGDAEIRQINRQHLQHDYATDVISFGYANDPPHVDGELVVSVETAERTAATLADWSTEQELLLYVVHGVLHLCGMDDGNGLERSEMRRAEHEVLVQLGIPEICRCGADSVPTSEPQPDGSTQEACE